MNEQRDIWAAREKAAEAAQKTAETRELKTLALAYKNAREVAGFFGRNTNASNGLEVSVTMSNNGYHSDVVNKLLRSVIPKNAELADAIWKKAVSRSSPPASAARSSPPIRAPRCAVSRSAPICCSRRPRSTASTTPIRRRCPTPSVTNASPMTRC